MLGTFFSQVFCITCPTFLKRKNIDSKVPSDQIWDSSQEASSFFKGAKKKRKNCHGILISRFLYMGTTQKKKTNKQGGPLPIISGVISPINGLING